MIDRKALQKLADPPDDKAELVQITKEDLRDLLAKCEMCALIFGLIVGMAIACIFILSLEHSK